MSKGFMKQVWVTAAALIVASLAIGIFWKFLFPLTAKNYMNKSDQEMMAARNGTAVAPGLDVVKVG